MDIGQLALALGASLTAGLNLYITILTLGLLHRFEAFSLPPSMEILANPWVLITAAILFVIEFIADKVPYIDNTWDAIHGFIRVPAGAILAVAALSDLPPHLVWIAALAGGFVSFSAHGAKASARLAVNASPEPVSNWLLSLLEDAISLVILWLVSNHPYTAIFLVIVLLVLSLTIIVFFYRFFRLLLRRRRPSGHSKTALSPGD